LSSKGQRSRSLGTKMQKSFFAHIFVKSGPIYVEPRPQWSSAIIHIVEYISPAKMLLVLWYLSVIILKGRMSQRPSGRTLILVSFCRMAYIAVKMLFSVLAFYPTVLSMVEFMLQCCVCLLSVTLCIVAKRCVLEQKLLWRAYGKSHIRNRLVPKWMTLTFV